MGAPKISDKEFIRLFESGGSNAVCEAAKCVPRSVFLRRRNLENKFKRRIVAPDTKAHIPQYEEHPGWINLTVKNGIVLVGGDAHVWPGPMAPAMKLFIKFIKELKPVAVVCNGDMLDFAAISRFPPPGWTKQPTPAEEIEAAVDQLHEIATAAGKARKIWPLGNHDGRFSRWIATHAKELANISGTKLSDHFPLWECCWACAINDDVVVKHKPNKGGVNSTRNSTLHAGRTTINNHLHSQHVRPFTDYNGTRYGVDTGCLANIQSRAFLDYTEAAPLDWRGGFAVLTFRNGLLMQPELVSTFDGEYAHWRGELIKI